jgi:putative spermidine/putrescine transport system permease protein
MMRSKLMFSLQLAFTLALSAFMIVPIVLSILGGLTTNYFRGPMSGMTLRWVFEIWSRYSDTILLSLGIALACLVINLAIGLPAAYVLVKRRSWLTRLFEELIVLPVAIPGLATALALILTYGRFGSFRTSWTFILVGHVLYTMPFMIRAVIAILSSIDLTSLEEAAASLGAGFWTKLTTVVVPNLSSGIVAGCLTVVTLSIGEFNLTLLLSTPMVQTMPVGLAVAYTNARIEIGSAYTIVFFIMIVPLLIALQIWGNPNRRPTRRNDGLGTQAK